MADICKAVQDAQTLVQQVIGLTDSLVGLSLRVSVSLARVSPLLDQIPTKTIHFCLIFVLSGICIVSLQLPDVVESLTASKLPHYAPSTVESACDDVITSFSVLADYVISDVTKNSEKVLEQTQAVPRLYRRTNREVSGVLLLLLLLLLLVKYRCYLEKCAIKFKCFLSNNSALKTSTP